eukprot:GHVP01010736.1.p1 GENE.GHVP01010736.1~~GHVP01010736.1.p1  ORF type:complete len:118 (+),score=16.94 GHVP01010736.1:120-473(+)
MFTYLQTLYSKIPKSSVHNAEIGAVRFITLKNKAFCVLPKLLCSPDGEVDCIEIYADDIDPKLLTKIGVIELKKIEEIRLYEKAFYILPKIVRSEKNEVDRIFIDTVSADIDKDTID